MISKRSAERNKPGFLLLRFGKLLFILGIMLMLSAGAFAQITDDAPGGPDGDPDAPFDGGISLLVAAGVAYGARQWRKGNSDQGTSTEPER